MTYVVTENCIRCKYMDCVEVCPVDCFYAGENMLVIHPDECIADSDEVSHRFRPKPATCSEANQPGIPTEAGRGGGAI